MKKAFNHDAGIAFVTAGVFALITLMPYLFGNYIGVIIALLLSIIGVLIGFLMLYWSVK